MARSTPTNTDSGAVVSGTLWLRDALPAPFDTKEKAPVAQLDRVLDSESRGRRFESCRARQ